MFTESKADTEPILTDYVPKKDYNTGFLKLCKQCRNFEHCPMFYTCETITRWRDREDLDYDNSLL